MISSLKEISYRFLKNNKKMTFACIIVIAIATFSLTSLINFSINSEQNLINMSQEKFGDFQIQAGYDLEDNKDISKDFISHIKSFEGVKKISLVLISNIDINNIDIYTLGLENNSLSKSKYKYKTDIDDEGAIINNSLAECLSLSKGDSIDINGVKKKVKEIYNDNLNLSQDINILIIDREELKKIMNTSNEANYIMIRTKDNMSYDVADKIAQYDRDLRVEMPEDNENESKNTNSLKYFVIVLGSLVFMMCGFFVLGNLKQFIYRYTRDFAIMKAMGADADQVLKVVLRQTVVINISGVLLGVLLTFLSVILFLRKFSICFKPILLVALLGFVIIQVILLVPSIKVANILPLRAIQNNDKVKIKKNSKFSTIIATLGLIICLDGIIRNGYNSFFEIIFGYLFFIVGYIKLIMNNIDKAFNFLNNLFEGFSCNIFKIAIKTLNSHIKKSKVIIVTIAMAMIITIFGNSFIGIINKNAEEYYKNEYLSDIVLSSYKDLDNEKSLELYEKIKAIDSIDSSIIFYGSDTNVKFNDDEEKVLYSYVDLDSFESMNNISKSDSNLNERAIVSKSFAEKNNINIGDNINLTRPYYDTHNVVYEDGSDKRRDYNIIVKVDDIAEDNIVSYNEILLDISNKEVIGDTISLEKIYINTTNTNIDEELSNLKKSYPTIKWSTLKEVLRDNKEATTIRWKYFNIALLIITVSSVFGMMTSIKNNINSNRKEYALLRSMKFTIKDLRKMLIYQVGIFLIIGEVIGYILGELGSFCIGGSFFISLEGVLVNISIATILLLIYLVPFIFKISKEKIVLELVQDEL